MAKKNITTKGDYITKATFKLLKYIGYSVKKLPTYDQVFDWYSRLVFLYSEEGIKAVEDSEEEYFKCCGANDITDRVGYFIESFDWECIKNN